MRESYHYDDADDRLTIQTVQDVEPVLEANKRAFNDNHGYKSEVFNKKAEIPDVIWMKWCDDNGIPRKEFCSNQKVLRRFLNDPANKFCLCKPGKV